MTTEAKQRAISVEVMAERKRQAEKFPASEQGLPDGTGASGYKTYRDIARHSCDRADREGRVTMAHIFEEEALEVLAEEEPTKLRVELVQVAAVCMKWIEELDRREPRVISGLDAVAATPEPAREAVPGHATNDFGDCQPWCQGCEWRTRRGLPTDWDPAAPPARPSCVEVGQRRRDSKGPYTVLRRAARVDSEVWVIRCDGEERDREWDDRFILADEFLTSHRDTSPAETPPAELQCDLKCAAGPCDPGCAPVAPAPPEPVKPELPMCTCADDFGPMAPCVPPCPLAKPAAAPAPGVGEGPRGITFGEACEVQRMCPGRVETDGGDPPAWHIWEPLEPMSLLAVAEQSHWNYRMKAPEPLPAPAPRVSRVREMVDAHIGDPDTAFMDRDVDMRRFAERVVKATQEEIRHQAIGSSWRGGELDALDLVLARARAAMLEPRK